MFTCHKLPGNVHGHWRHLGKLLEPHRLTHIVPHIADNRRIVHGIPLLTPFRLAAAAIIIIIGMPILNLIRRIFVAENDFLIEIRFLVFGRPTGRCNIAFRALADAQRVDPIQGRHTDIRVTALSCDIGSLVVSAIGEQYSLVNRRFSISIRFLSS